MKKLTKYMSLSALLMLLSLSAGVQAATVSEGFKSGPSWVESGTITLDPGSYTLDLLVFGFGGPTIFGIANTTESFQVALGSIGLGTAGFNTAGGTFSFLVGGNAGAGTIYNAAINAVPLPPALGMLGAGIVALATIGGRKRA